ncbi:autophagy protein atg9 [Dipsacomyces acuminosporus]|nr:autophagy protein atg9 [Dipsacomyces acuminosporus]
MSIAARTRGLTSTLSSRRQRHDAAGQDRYSSSPASTAPDTDSPHPHTFANMYDSQAQVSIPMAASHQNSDQSSLPSVHQKRASSRISPRLNVGPAAPSKDATNSNSAAADHGSRSAESHEAFTYVDSYRNDGIDDEGDTPPPDSLLIEVPADNPGQAQQGQAFGDTGPFARREQVYPNEPQVGSVRRGAAAAAKSTARAMQNRLRDISDHTQRALHFNVPIPPQQRQRSAREAFGDGRVFSIQEEASAAWTRRSRKRARGSSSSGGASMSHRERALRAWRDAKHQDEFFCRVYSYYAGKGALTIILSRILQLITLAFVVVLSTFVFGCIDHAKVREQKSLSAVVNPQCLKQFSWTVTIFLWAFALFWAAQLSRTLADIPSLLEIRSFFTEVLGIQSADISTIAWHEVVNRMVALRDAEIREYRDLTKSRILSYRLTVDAVINRIMRRENYMIALFNRDLLDIDVPIMGKRQGLTKALEWNLSFCLMNYLFDERGQLRRRFLKESNRSILSEGLRRRFKFMAIINLVFAPFIVVFLILYSFFRYFEEIYHEPGTITSRAFTPFAKWKFRNFNEVPHSFRRRLNAAHPKATLYLGQFRNDAVITVAKFASFISGAFTALLLAFTVVDNELSLEFEITHHRTVLFYIGLFGAILAAARGMVPADEQEYLHPAWIIRDVLEDLQYMEPEWRGKLDTTKVRRDFESLFNYKLASFLNELLGVITAPFIMYFSLPRCADGLIDFFREFSVHVDHLGYVCSFAVFDFERHGNVKFSAPTRVAAEHLASRNGKMEQSFLSFKAEYPEWQPRDQAASIYLQRAQNAQQDLWRMGSVVSGAGWQGRLLQQQRMAGSIFPTGASLYRPSANLAAAEPAAPTLPANANVNAVANTGDRQPGALGKSQFAFRPFGFNPSQQVLASQTMLPFGPTLGTAANGPTKGKEPQNAGPDTATSSDRLALSSLPLVASPELGNSLAFSMNAGRGHTQAGIFSIVNQLYEQQML